MNLYLNPNQNQFVKEYPEIQYQNPEDKFFKLRLIKNNPTFDTNTDYRKFLIKNTDSIISYNQYQKINKCPLFLTYKNINQPMHPKPFYNENMFIEEQTDLKVNYLNNLEKSKNNYTNQIYF